MKGAFVFIRDIVIALIVALILLQFISPSIVRGESMANTLHESDYVFLNKMIYKMMDDVDRGDVIVFESDMYDEDGEHQKKLIKRVIALPGDTVEIAAGAVYVNDSIVEESYLKDGYTEGTYEETVVPEGKIFVLGDNRQYSSDSRDESIGMVDMDMIVGEAIYRVFPISDFGKID